MDAVTCSECHWTNTNLLNLGEPDKPRWVCHGCCKRGFDKLAELERRLAEAREALGKIANAKLEFVWASEAWQQMREVAREALRLKAGEGG